MSDAFNFQRVVISLIISLLLIITFCIPTSFIKAISSPLRGIGRIYPLSLGTEGNENAGIKGYEFEYAYLKTSEWTTLIGDLEDGNSMLRVDMINIPGTGLDLGFGITYNSFNSDINIGLGKGWTSDLHQSVYEDPLTHNVTYVTSTGAKLVFEYDAETGKYNSPKGFSGELTKTADNNYELTTIGKEKLTFSSDGKLRRMEKCGGGSYEVNYDTSGNPISMIDTISGRNITLTWDETGKLTEVKDSMNQKWTLNYSDDYNKLLSIKKPDNTSTTFNYTDDFKMIEHKDFLGHTYTIGYYTEGVNSGKLKSWTDPSSATTTFNYETNVGDCEKRTTVTDGEGKDTLYCFGESEHLEEVKEQSGTEVISLGLEYDTAGTGLIKAMYNSEGKKLFEIARDTVGHPLIVSYPDPTEAGELFIGEQYTYTPANSLDGNLTEIKETIDLDPQPTYATTTMEYGPNGDFCNPTKITDPMGTETNITYNDNNQPITITTGTGPYSGSLTKSMSFSYNSNNGNLTSTTDFQGNLSTYSYNANGFPTNIKSYEGTAQLLNDKTISYNAMNKATGTADAVTGLTSSITRDDNGATTSTTSEGGCSKSTGFDPTKATTARGRIDPGDLVDPGDNGLPPWMAESITGGFERAAIDPDPIIPPYVPLPVTQSNTQGHTTSYEYYKDSSIKKITDYLGRSTNYYNDSFGRTNHILDWDGTDTYITYDPNSRITQREIEGIGTYSYIYDNADRLITVSDPIKGTIIYSYNLRGDLLEDDKGSYSYDLLGRRVSATYIGIGGGSDSWTYSRESFLLGKNEFAYGRDKLGNMTSYSNSSGTATINYLSALSLPTEIVGSGNLGSYSFNYDNKHWLYRNILTDKAIPGIPTDLTGTIEGDCINLQWNDNSEVEDGFRLHKTVIYPNNETIDYILPVDPNPGTGIVNYQDCSYVGGYTYIYQVCAFDIYGESPYTEPPLTLPPPMQGKSKSLSIEERNKNNNALSKNNLLSDSDQPLKLYYSWNQDGTLSGILYPNNTNLNITYHNRIQDNITLTKDGNTLFNADATFDGYDRLTSEAIDITIPNGTISEDYSFSYDTLSRLNTLHYSSNNRTITYGYDLSLGNRLTEVSFSDTGTYSITYDEKGRIDYVTYPNNQGIENYTYNDIDGRGRLSNITYPDGKSLSFSWNSRGKLTQLTAVEGSNETNIMFSYDGMNRISGYNKTITELGSPPQTEEWNFYYGITGIDKATRIENGIQNLTMDYSTDTNGRILSAAYTEAGGFTGNLTYVYDNYGNIIACKLDDGDMAKAVLINPNNGAIDTRYDPNDIDDPFSYRARDGFIGIGPLWANNDDGTVYMQGHVVIPNPWGNVSTNGTTTTTTDDTTDKDAGDNAEPCGSGHYKECYEACYRGQTGRDIGDDWNILQNYEAICGELKARNFWTGVVIVITAFLGITTILAGKIAGFVISTIWSVVGGMTTAELNRRRGELEGKNPWLKDPKKREAAYEAMRYCADRCIRYDGYGEAIE